MEHEAYTQHAHQLGGRHGKDEAATAFLRRALAVFLSFVLVCAFTPVEGFAEELEGAASVEDAEGVEDASTQASEGTSAESDFSEDASSGDGIDSAAEATASIESFMSSWRYSEGEVAAHPNTGSTDTLSTMASAYSTWKASYGSSYYGIVSGSTTTKVSVSGVVRVGIDVSKWQGDIDWDKVAAAGIDYAIIRCGYGSDYEDQDDEYFVQNIQGAIEAGLEVGVYLYSYATKVTGSTSAASEAAHVLRMLEEAGVDADDLDLPVFLDMEDDTQAALSASMLGKIATEFCETLAAEGYAVGIYANQNWWTNYLTDDAFDNELWYKWVARYPTATSATSSGVSDTDIWQFTSSGTVSGIDGNVDVDFDYVGSGGYTGYAPGATSISSAVKSGSLSTVTLTWSEAAGATGYQIWRSVNGGSYQLVKTISSASTLTWANTARAAGSTYRYKVRAVRTVDGTTYYGSFSSVAKVEMLPSVVTIKSATKTSAYTTITLTWGKVACASGYEVWRSIDGGSYTKVKTITSGSTLTWANVARALGKTYRYKVRAYTTVNGTKYYGSFSSVSKVATIPNTVSITSAVKSSDSTTITLTWNKISGASGYEVWRSINGGSYTKVKTITSGSTVTWANTKRALGKTYRYKIRAYKTVNGTTYYGNFSSVSKVVTG